MELQEVLIAFQRLYALEILHTFYLIMQHSLLRATLSFTVKCLPYQVLQNLDLQRQRKISINFIVSSKTLNHTQVLHTNRINLSPFTKDFRVWGTPIETLPISLRVTLG